MQTQIGQKLKFHRIASTLTIIMGIILLTYMIMVEDELGALPLLLLITGIVWFIISQIKFKNSKI